MRMMTQVCSNKDKNIMQVIEKDGVHWVEVGAFTAGPFATNAEAWSWIERHADEGRDDGFMPVRSSASLAEKVLLRLCNNSLDQPTSTLFPLEEEHVWAMDGVRHKPRPKPLYPC
jgi:hypothetical protein